MTKWCVTRTQRKGPGTSKLEAQGISLDLLVFYHINLLSFICTHCGMRLHEYPLPPLSFIRTQYNTETERCSLGTIHTLTLPSSSAAQVKSAPAAKKEAVAFVPRSTAASPAPISPMYLPRQ